jgi:two-component system response regulator FixJ
MTRKKVVCVIDDDGPARDSLAFLLEADGFLVEPYESAVTFLDAWLDSKAGCVVTDVRMPGMDGLALLRELRLRGDTRPVIVVSGHADIPLAIEAIGSGAFDFVEKPFEAEILLGLVRAALDPQLGNSSIEFAKNEVEERIATLTDRERQVFDRLVLGHSNGSIVRDLGLAERIVEVHRANVMTKMDAPNLSRLVHMALVVQASEI